MFSFRIDSSLRAGGTTGKLIVVPGVEHGGAGFRLSVQPAGDLEFLDRHLQAKRSRPAGRFYRAARRLVFRLARKVFLRNLIASA